MSQTATRFSPASTSSEELLIPMPPNPMQAKFNVAEGALLEGVAPRTCLGMIIAPSANLALSATKSRRVKGLIGDGRRETGDGSGGTKRSFAPEDTSLAFHTRYRECP